MCGQSSIFYYREGVGSCWHTAVGCKLVFFSKRLHIEFDLCRLTGSMARNEPVDAGQTVHGHIDTVANQQKSGSIVPFGSEAVAREPCNTAMFIIPDGMLCWGY